MVLGYSCLFLVYAPNEKTGIPLTSNTGYSKRLNLKIKALKGKEVPNTNFLGTRRTLRK
jgi:hypothetical protein